MPTLMVVDSRWQMVLYCLGVEEPAFSQGSVFNFRVRAIKNGWHRLLVERTVKLARESKGYSAAALRAALDSSPLWGAGRVEYTFNLIGWAAGQLVESVEKRLGETPEDVAERAGIPLVTASSVKAHATFSRSLLSNGPITCVELGHHPNPVPPVTRLGGRDHDHSTPWRAQV